MSIDIRITKAVELAPEELAQVPTVRYYAHGAEWSQITITYQYDTEGQRWLKASVRGWAWRLTSKGARVKNSLSSVYAPDVPKAIIEANTPSEKITIAVVETGEML